MSRRPTIAIAHDYLTQRGGAERVVLAMLRAFPTATIYTTLYDPEGTFPEFREARIVTSPLNRIGLLRRNHRLAMPLLAWAAGRVRPDADVTLVSTSGWAHGFGPTGASLVYCHNPARWLYQSDEYLGSAGRLSPQRLLVRLLGAGLRRWDARAAARHPRYLANSTVVRQRIKDTYGIEARLLHPPYAVDPSDASEPVPALADWDDWHLVVSRLMPYKNVEQVVAAFAAHPERRLVIVGAGPSRETIAAALPPNVRLLSALSDGQLRWCYTHARALVAASYEDFGLTPLEAAAYGVPAVTLRAGGYLDTIVEERTGVHFDQPTAAAIAAAVDRAEAISWDAATIRAHADRFSPTHFEQALHAELADVMN